MCIGSGIKKRRKQLQDGGLDFGDGGIPLWDLRFADDIFGYLLHFPMKQPGRWMNWKALFGGGRFGTKCFQNIDNSKRSGNGNFGCDKRTNGLGACYFIFSFIFFFLRSFLAAEGPLTQGCCTGQPPGTDCFYTGQSPDVLVVGKV